MQTIQANKLSLRPGMRVLDLGCGRGRHAHALGQQNGVVVVGLDRNLDDLATTREGFALFPAKAGGHVVGGDAYRLPFADHSFDAVVCSEVLEHLHDYRAALSEIARVTKPAGCFALSVPRAWPEAICWRLAPQYPREPGGHVRIFNAKALKRDVVNAGFSPVGRGYFAHGLHSPYWWLKCALWQRRDDHPVIKAYQRLLEWDILQRPWLTRALDAALNPVMGKSVVFHFTRHSVAESRT